MRETITEKGIASKHIMVALANGGILELPWVMVDPRRPTNPEIREEGVIPYMPEIPIHMDAIVNYNQSVFRVSGIYTSPSGLESTCLVFVHGLGKSSNILRVLEYSALCTTLLKKICLKITVSELEVFMHKQSENSNTFMLEI